VRFETMRDADVAHIAVLVRDTHLELSDEKLKMRN
jgi:hypothetical protein